MKDFMKKNLISILLGVTTISFLVGMSLLISRNPKAPEIPIPQGSLTPTPVTTLPIHLPTTVAPTPAAKSQTKQLTPEIEQKGGWIARIYGNSQASIDILVDDSGKYLADIGTYHSDSNTPTNIPEHSYDEVTQTTVYYKLSPNSTHIIKTTDIFTPGGTSKIEIAPYSTTAQSFTFELIDSRPSTQSSYYDYVTTLPNGTHLYYVAIGNESCHTDTADTCTYEGTLYQKNKAGESKIILTKKPYYAISNLLQSKNFLLTETYHFDGVYFSLLNLETLKEETAQDYTKLLTSEDEIELWGYAFSKLNNAVYFIRASTQETMIISEFSVTTAQVKDIATLKAFNPGTTNTLTVSKDGKYLSVAGFSNGSEGLYVLSLATGEQIWQFMAQNGAIAEKLTYSKGNAILMLTLSGLPYQAETFEIIGRY